MKKRFIWINLALTSFLTLVSLAIPLTVQAGSNDIEDELREGTREVRKARREAAEEILDADSHSRVEREIREGAREVERERRERRREVKRAIRRDIIDWD